MELNTQSADYSKSKRNSQERKSLLKIVLLICGLSWPSHSQQKDPNKAQGEEGHPSWAECRARGGEAQTPSVLGPGGVLTCSVFM